MPVPELLMVPVLETWPPTVAPFRTTMPVSLLVMIPALTSEPETVLEFSTTMPSPLVLMVPPRALVTSRPTWLESVTWMPMFALIAPLLVMPPWTEEGPDETLTVVPPENTTLALSVSRMPAPLAALIVPPTSLTTSPPTWAPDKRMPAAPEFAVMVPVFDTLPPTMAGPPV